MKKTKFKTIITILVLVFFIFAGGEELLRYFVVKKNVYAPNSAISPLLLYTGEIRREPHKKIKFKFFVFFILLKFSSKKICD